MWIIVIAWMYVAVLMAVAEAVHSGSTIGGALMTFIAYGLAPMLLVVYLVSTPARRKRRRLQEQLGEVAEPVDNAAPPRNDAQ